MEDEDQLQSLAKRLVNIYNACRWSKTKLRIRRKKRTPRITNDQTQPESFTEIESGNSIGTVLVYDRNIRRTGSIEGDENRNFTITSNQVEGLEQQVLFSEDIHQFRNDPTVNVCSCKKCACQPEKSSRPKYDPVDRRGLDYGGKNSKLILTSTPVARDETSVPKKPKGKVCCCTSPKQYGAPTPLRKKKSSIRTTHPVQVVSKDCMSQCIPPSDGGNCDKCPPCVLQRNMVGSQTASLQFITPEPNEAACCECPLSFQHSLEHCECPVKNLDCCQCATPRTASFGCQCIPPQSSDTGPPSPCCPPEAPCRRNRSSCCCDSEGYYANTCDCPSEDDLNMRTDRIIMPSMYYNDEERGRHSGHSSHETSEEVKNETLNEYSSEESHIQTRERSKNTGTSSRRDMRHSNKPTTPPSKVPSTPHKKASPETHSRASSAPQRKSSPVPHSQPAAVPHSRDASVPHSRNASVPHSKAASVPQSRASATAHPKAAPVPIPMKDRPCHCSKKEVHDSNIEKCSDELECDRKKRCHGTCCKCPQFEQFPTEDLRSSSKEPSRQARQISSPERTRTASQIQPSSTSVHTYPPDQEEPPSDTKTSLEERFIAKHSPEPFSDKSYYNYGDRLSPTTTDHIYPPASTKYESRVSPTPTEHVYPPGITKYESHVSPTPKASTYPPSEAKPEDDVHPHEDHLYPPILATHESHLSRATPDRVHSPSGPPPPLGLFLQPPRFVDTKDLLKEASMPAMCKKHVVQGEGDIVKIGGINTETEAEIYATLRKIEMALRDEADMHSRNVRCIVDQVCKQGCDIKELKVLVAGVVEDSKTPSAKEVEKKIKKLQQRKEREAKYNREMDMEERERLREEAKLEAISHGCCKCGEKKAHRMGCCGKCCAKRCWGCCGVCCGGCCPKCCDTCCFPCEKCCPCCCLLARCCDACWSMNCFGSGKRKCKCSNL